MIEVHGWVGGCETYPLHSGQDGEGEEGRARVWKGEEERES